MNRRSFNKNLGLTTGLIGIGALQSCAPSSGEQDTTNERESNMTTAAVSPELAQRMYDKAPAVTRSKVRGEDAKLFFKEPLIELR